MSERGRREEGEGGERGREAGGGEPGRKRRGEERRNREELGAGRDTQTEELGPSGGGGGKRGRGEEPRGRGEERRPGLEGGAGRGWGPPPGLRVGAPGAAECGR